MLIKEKNICIDNYTYVKLKKMKLLDQLQPCFPDIITKGKYFFTYTVLREKDNVIRVLNGNLLLGTVTINQSSIMVNMGDTFYINTNDTIVNRYNKKSAVEHRKYKFKQIEQQQLINFVKYQDASWETLEMILDLELITNDLDLFGFDRTEEIFSGYRYLLNNEEVALLMSINDNYTILSVYFTMNITMNEHVKVKYHIVTRRSFFSDTNQYRSINKNKISKYVEHLLSNEFNLEEMESILELK